MNPFPNPKGIVLLILSTVATPANAQRPDPFESARRQLVQEEIIGAGVTNKRVIESMVNTKRHEFVPRQLRNMAYYDMALPIGDKQTISSPFIVAYMTECLDPQPTDRVLEIGTGSGFQAAVLSPLVDRVYTIEIVDTLGRKAARVLDRLNYDNVFPKVGDGFKGWPEHAPFDKIIVTCSPEKVPQPLVDQLKDGGLMVIPVGERYQQTMYLMRKVDGKLEKEVLRPTLFVPMTGTAESRREVPPDPANPKVVNGSFEEDDDEDGFVSGWYYQRQVERVESDESPVGAFHVRFKNSDAGRGSRLLQGMGIDGRVVHEIVLSAWVATSDVVPGPEQAMPRVLISFYDDQRAHLGQSWLGPWRGSVDWRKESRKVRVPARAREAIIRVGLLGATGTAKFDDIRIDLPDPPSP